MTAAASATVGEPFAGSGSSASQVGLTLIVGDGSLKAGSGSDWAGQLPLAADGRLSLCTTATYQCQQLRVGHRHMWGLWAVEALNSSRFSFAQHHSAHLQT